MSWRDVQCREKLFVGNETGEIIDVGETLRKAKITLGEMMATMVNLKAEVAKLRSLFANMSLNPPSPPPNPPPSPPPSPPPYPPPNPPPSPPPSPSPCDDDDGCDDDDDDDDDETKKKSKKSKKSKKMK